MNICVGVVTNNRQKSAVKLLSQLIPQLQHNDHIYVVENGSKQLYFLNGKSKCITYLNLGSASIPKARNRVIEFADQKQFEITAFVDDDCSVPENWISTIRSEFQKHMSLKVLFGKTISTPIDHIYSYITDQLHHYWINSTSSDQCTTAFDTKNCAIQTEVFQQNHIRFNESLTRASDVEVGKKLAELKISIVYQPKLVVFHPVATNLANFLKKRVQLSKHHSLVTNSQPSLRESFLKTWYLIKVRPKQTLHILGIIFLIGVSTRISN